MQYHFNSLALFAFSKIKTLRFCVSAFVFCVISAIYFDEPA